MTESAGRENMVGGDGCWGGGVSGRLNESSSLRSRPSFQRRRRISAAAISRRLVSVSRLPATPSPDNENKGAYTSKIKHAMKHKTSLARLAQLLQPSLAFCFRLQPMTAYRLGLQSSPNDSNNVDSVDQTFCHTQYVLPAFSRENQSSLDNFRQ